MASSPLDPAASIARGPRPLDKIASVSRKHFKRLVNLPDLLREAVWRRTHSYESPYPLSFPPDPSMLAVTRIRWPRVLQWVDAENYAGALRTGLARLVDVEIADDLEQGAGLVNIELVVNGRAHPVTIDYSDHFDYIVRRHVERAAVYFKMQFHRDGYSDHTIVPGGFVSGTTVTYSYLSPILQSAQSQPPLYDAYGRFGLKFAREIREDAVRRLNSQSYFHYEGGAKLVRYSAFLQEASRSRVVIDLPSNSDFCFRLIDYFALGGCIVAWPHRTVLHVPVQAGKHLLYCREDMSDLVDLCREYIEDDGKREAIKSSAREYFDRYLHKDQLAAYYLHTAFRFIQ
jgi:hypothetical protein